LQRRLHPLPVQLENAAAGHERDLPALERSEEVVEGSGQAVADGDRIGALAELDGDLDHLAGRIACRFRGPAGSRPQRIQPGSAPWRRARSSKADSESRMRCSRTASRFWSATIRGSE